MLLTARENEINCQSSLTFAKKEQARICGRARGFCADAGVLRAVPTASRYGGRILFTNQRINCLITSSILNSDSRGSKFEMVLFNLFGGREGIFKRFSLNLDWIVIQLLGQNSCPISYYIILVNGVFSEEIIIPNKKNRWTELET